MITIYKYLVGHMPTSIMLQKGAEIHSVGQDPNSNSLCIWARVDTDQPHEKRQFIVFSTGYAIDSALVPILKFLGTVVTRERLAYHIYEVMRGAAE